MHTFLQLNTLKRTRRSKAFLALKTFKLSSMAPKKISLSKGSAAESSKAPTKTKTTLLTPQPITAIPADSTKYTLKEGIHVALVLGNKAKTPEGLTFADENKPVVFKLTNAIPNTDIYEDSREGDFFSPMIRLMESCRLYKAFFGIPNKVFQEHLYEFWMTATVNEAETEIKGTIGNGLPVIVSPALYREALDLEVKDFDTLPTESDMKTLRKLVCYEGKTKNTVLFLAGLDGI